MQAQTHVMIDLETMSSNMDAAIVSIGAVVFDPYGPVLQFEDLKPNSPTTFYTNVDLQSSLNAGLGVSGSTIMWWLGQSQEAREAIRYNATPLERALQGFSEWLYKLVKEQRDELVVWAHANFDLAILHSAYIALGYERLPWNYYNARDVRTIYNLAYPNPNDQVLGIPNTNLHHALYDAARQAIGVQICYKQLNLVK